MMSLQRPRRCREVTGPTPHSVAVRARPTNKHPPEKIILDRRKMEDARELALQQSRHQKSQDLRNDWERTTDRRIQSNTVKRRVESYLKAEEFRIEDRRERLREMLAKEQESYLEEMEVRQETTLERQARMRERAKQLKEKRETERLAYVEKKYDQLFRNQCEELRSTMSKRHQDEVSAERLEQIKVKAMLAEKEEEDDKIYEEMWYADKAAKAAREEKEAKAKQERDAEVLRTLEKQIAALHAKKAEKKRLQEEEAELLKEQFELRKLEEQKALEEKNRRMREAKKMLETTRRLRMKKLNKEIQEELAFDMKMLEKLLEESRNEAMETEKRMREKTEEDKRYRAYLKNMAAEEKAREFEFDRMLDEEVERSWQKRLAQWELERQAREKLMNDVLEYRKMQVETKRRQNEEAQELAKQEVAMLAEKIKENRRLEEEKERIAREKWDQHQADLMQQINYNKMLRATRAEEEEREFLLYQQAEKEYQRKLQEALDNPYDDKMHPMRRALFAKYGAEMLA